MSINFRVKSFAESEVLANRRQYPINRSGELIISVEEYQEPNITICIYDVYFRVDTDIMQNKIWRFDYIDTRPATMKLLT